MYSASVDEQSVLQAGVWPDLSSPELTSPAAPQDPEMLKLQPIPGIAEVITTFQTVFLERVESVGSFGVVQRQIRSTEATEVTAALDEVRPI